ncbi:MFS transporter [Cellulomonas xiejunii]|uniref:MFS transporter n=1 Tax=Cellulomonas xiejunii TaxID=2968083 RepID=A0ABY5KUS1_9CELL|nr:MFS transporter [Cellulomonas xiejunii]MCC2321510.1 MFS transporter [Cellulomonas xiejunii]MCC2323338.1 MFS transporter [Cellulomonas xiejunii]UUI72083.1 MFS transporter [Cellulomonas xiejunii]
MHATPDTDAPDSLALRRARWTLTVIFAAHGAAVGTFATRIPWIQEQAGLSAGELGLALAAPAIGATFAMPMAGRVVHRLGGRGAVRLLMLLWCLGLLLPALSQDLRSLFVALVLFGVTSGMADVAINGQGVVIEKRLGRSVMSSLHGAWSVGTLIAGIAGTLAARAELDTRVHFGAAALVLAGVVLVACCRLLPARPVAGAKAPPRFALPPRATWWLCLVGFCAVFAEGAAGNWTAVYLTNITDASDAVAAAAYTCFTVAIAATRVLGDMVVRRIGPVRTVRVSGAVATAGAVLVAVSRNPLPAAVGFVLLGIGVAVVLPLVFAAVGRASSDPSHAIAGVATVTYSSNLIAPAVVGGVAGLFSLSASFVLVAVLTSGLVAVAGALAVGSRSGAQDDAAEGADAGWHDGRCAGGTTDAVPVGPGATGPAPTDAA